MSHRYSSLSVRALAVLVFALLQHVARATELTFELQDKEEHCFYEVAPKAGSKLALEYQVVYGGQLDVDVVVRDPNNVIVYEEPKKTIDDKTFVADTPGEYEVLPSYLECGF
jgi:protein ERP2